MDQLYTRAVLIGQKADETGRKVYSFRATSDVVDRQGEIVTLDGWDFANWAANPVILDSHDYWGGIEAIVGRGVPPLRLEEGAWVVDVVFSDTPKGRLAQQLVEEGSLRAVSVGFRSQQTEHEPNMPLRHTRKELLEISVVPIPANQDALRVRGLAATLEAKAGRTLSAKNENLIRSAAEALQAVLSSLGSADEEQPKSASGEKAADAAEPVLAVDLDAMRAFVGGQK